MAKVNERRFRREDYEGADDYFFKFTEKLNRFMEEVVSAFGNRISIDDNINGETRFIGVNYNELPIRFTLNSQNRRIGHVTPTRFVNRETQEEELAPRIAWRQEGNQILITKISRDDGIEDGIIYDLSLILYER